ncbi:hypothetical protein D3C71_1518060 [compost metagenome]
MDVAVGNDFGAKTHHGHHHQVGAARIHLLAGAQGLVHHHGAGAWHGHFANDLHLAHDFADDLAHLGGGGLRTGRRCIGRYRQPCGARSVHLGGVAAAHGHGQGAAAAQLGHDGGKVDGRLGLAHGGQVDQHGVVVKKARGVSHALGQVGGELRGVGGLEHHGHHGQRGALEVKAGAGLRRRRKGHEWIAGMYHAKGATRSGRRPHQKDKVYCARPQDRVTERACAGPAYRPLVW